MTPELLDRPLHGFPERTNNFCICTNFSGTVPAKCTASVHVGNPERSLSSSRFRTSVDSVAGDAVKRACDERVAQRCGEPARLAPVQKHERERDMFLRLHHEVINDIGPFIPLIMALKRIGVYVTDRCLPRAARRHFVSHKLDGIKNH